MRIDVLQSAELKATLLAMRTVDRTIQKMVRQQVKAVAGPEWVKALTRRANSKLDRRVLVDTATVAASNQNLRVQSATKGRRLSGGFAPKTDWHSVEFGVDPNRKITYTRANRGGSGRHRITRRVGNSLPGRVSRGRVFYPTAREMVPRMARLVVQTTVRTIATALEGKQE